MKKLNNKSGFTLIEIIVVLIIVGILAAIALPNLFSNVAKSKSAEALTLTEAFKTQLEACLQANLSANCVPTLTAGGGGAVSTVGAIADPDNANVTFTMSTAPVVNAGYAGLTYGITATSANDAASSITMLRNVGGTVTCTGAGAWAGAC